MLTKINQSYNLFTRNFYIYRFFKDFAFIYAVYVILFKLKGLSVFEISLLLALWAGFVVILEVPTGALADKWNRKYMLSLGMLSKAIGFGIWLFADGFWLFALGFLLWSIQETFCSGTQEALLFDNLKIFKREDDYEKVAGRGHFYSKIAIGTSIFLGGFLASYSFDIVIILSSFSMIIAIIPTLFFNEVKFKKTPTEETKYFHFIKNAFRESLKNKLLLRLLIYSIFAIGIIESLDEYEQLYFNWAGLPIAFFGVIAVIIGLSEAFGGRIAYKFKEYFKNQNSIYILALLSGIALAISVSYKSLFMLPIFVLVFLFMSISQIHVESELQRQIKTDERATITSINSLLLNLSGIILFILFGILSRIGNLTWGLLGFALLLILFSMVSIIFNRKK